MTVVAPFASVLLVTRDGMRDLPAVLDALAAQRVDFGVETVAVDSGSTDGTVPFLRARVDRLLEVAPASFNHGATRNYGIEHCRGEVVVLLVQDAVPAGASWLAELAAPLREDAQVAGSFARQVPRTDAGAITRYYHARWPAAGTAPRRVTVAGEAAFARLGPAERQDLCTFDNVCSCVRRAVWREHPFPTAPIAEDLAWARAVLLTGHALAFAPRAVVVHSHERSPLYELKRTCLVHAQLQRLFGLRTIGSLAGLGLSVAWALRAHVDCVRSDRPGRRGPELLRGLGLAVAWPLGQYLGGRSAAQGWPPLDGVTGV
jgi:rhamnosyltransferase